MKTIPTNIKATETGLNPSAVTVPTPVSKDIDANSTAGTATKHNIAPTMRRIKPIFLLSIEPP